MRRKLVKVKNNLLLILALLIWISITSVFAQDSDRPAKSQYTKDEQTVANIEQLAISGVATAQYQLGELYEYGRVVDPSDAAAIAWYKKASVQGLGDAQYKLGVMYDNGWGVRSNNAEAVKWYRSAAEQGHSLAQHDLAFMYFQGAGVSKSSTQAYKWLSIALASGNSLMKKHLELVAEELTEAEIELAENLALDWLGRSNK